MEVSEKSEPERRQKLNAELGEQGKTMTLTGEAQLELTNKFKKTDYLNVVEYEANPHFVVDSANVKNNCWSLSDTIVLKSDDSSSVFKVQLTLEPGTVDPRYAQLAIHIHEEAKSQFAECFFKMCKLTVDLLGIGNADTDVCMADNTDKYFAFVANQIHFRESEANKHRNYFDIWTVVEKFCKKTEVKNHCQLKKIKQINPSNLNLKENEILSPGSTPDCKVAEYEFIPARVTVALEIYLNYKESKSQLKQQGNSQPIVNIEAQKFRAFQSAEDLVEGVLLEDVKKLYLEFVDLRRQGRLFKVWFNWSSPHAIELMRFGYITAQKCIKFETVKFLGLLQDLMDICENVLCEHLKCRYEIQSALDIWLAGRKYRRPQLESKALFYIFQSNNQLVDAINECENINYPDEINKMPELVEKFSMQQDMMETFCVLHKLDIRSSICSFLSQSDQKNKK